MTDPTDAPEPTRPTLLRDLVRQRHWQAYKRFRKEYDRVAAEIDRELVGTYPSAATYRRWLSGRIGGIPRSEPCAVLEAMFPDHTVEQLFEPSAKTVAEWEQEPRTADKEMAVSDGPPNNGEDVADVLRRIDRLSRAADPAIVDQLGETVLDYISQYERYDHSESLPVLLKIREWVDVLLGECCNAGQRQELFRIATGASGLLGYLAVGRGNFRLSRAYCMEAFKLAEFALDSNLQAWARGLQSFCEYYARNYRESLRLAEDGLAYSTTGPQGVRLMINGVARAMGKLGDVEGVHRSVDKAFLLVAKQKIDGFPSSISLECYSPAQVASNAATAYVSLGVPHFVEKYINMARPEVDMCGSPWTRSLTMLDQAVSLASAARRTSDLDQAASLATNALALSSGRPIVSVRQRAADFVSNATENWGPAKQIDAVREIVADGARW